MKTIKLNSALSKILLSLFALVFIVVACDEDDNFQDSVPDYAEAIIRSFKVGDKFATINHTTATTSITLPAGTNISNVKPQINLPEAASVTPASGSTIDFSQGPVTFVVESSNGAKRTYTAYVGAFGAPRILTFSVGENQGTIDDGEGTIAIEIGSQDGDVTNLSPTFTIAVGTTVDVASGVSRDFTNPVKYTVLSNDGFTAREYLVTLTQLPNPFITNFGTGEDICSVTGVIDNDASTIELTFPAGSNLAAVTPIIEVTEGSTINPESGLTQDFSSGPVEYTVTNVEGLTKTYSVSAQTIASSGEVVFIGAEECVNALVDDDAKAAALYLQQEYPTDFSYVQFSNISASTLTDAKVIMLYYLTPLEDLGFGASPTDISTMLPPELRAGALQAEALKTWAKNGGDMLIAGDPTPFLFSLGRVPADFSQPRAPGNYVYSEFGCAGSTGCVDTGKPPSDIWGLGMRDSNNSGPRQGDAIFSGLTFENGEFLALQNSATREVRLIWWQHFDGILNPSCCGQDAALLFEQTFTATKYGTLSFIGDAFGYGAVEWKRTDQGNDANFDTQIPTDFKGHVFSIENTIIGYEWDSNGTVNDYQGNIELFTKNIIEHLRGLNND